LRGNNSHSLLRAEIFVVFSAQLDVEQQKTVPRTLWYTYSYHRLADSTPTDRDRAV